MFKRSDLSMAVGLLISGYIREEEPGETVLLEQALSAIKGEVEDWEENLEPLIEEKS